MDTPEKIATLIFHFLRNDLSDKDKAELERWRASSPDNEKLFVQLSRIENNEQLLQQYQRRKQDIWERINPERKN